ncbi:recombinase family protein [Comamonas sp. Z1]|uniref:recombinase family protein n=1 Tax=Comamonas sp. Z1 TaxID=2601246 RepID=UPI0011E74A7D|nr:recombinase family protein [Comamonas sp. Z1]TYK76238.1 recombinase family protein [Comamonas sp. Z1]
MRYGYARVSTIEQDTALQDTALANARCDQVVREKRSAVKKRPELEALLQSLKPGDTLIVYKLDRLARSLRDLIRIAEHVQASGAKLLSLTEPIDIGTPMGRMVLQILGVVAEFERSLIRERCMAGQLEAVKRGKMIGRPSRIPLADQNEMIQLVGCGISLRDIADAYGVHESTVRRFYDEAVGYKTRRFGQIRRWLYDNKKPT